MKSATTISSQLNGYESEENNLDDDNTTDLNDSVFSSTDDATDNEKRILYE